MERMILAWLLALAFLATGIFFWLTEPSPLAATSLPQHIASTANGELIYHIGGCISCHKGADANLPSGGEPFKTPIGTFYPPNLTPDAETGIGQWSEAQFVTAVQLGISPKGQHYIPAFPYASYHRMRTEDVLDMFAYLKTLSPVASPTKAPDVPVEWALRRATGIWKLFALHPPINDDPVQSAEWNRGHYLVTGPGHCGECHSPRNIMMVSDETHALEGAPHPEGKGRVPSLRDLIGRGKYESVDDLADALSLGELGGYDRLSSGGMAEVQANIAKLPEMDIRAIAEYLGTLK
jgi:mono/diheme cytochrome c family protein